MPSESAIEELFSQEHSVAFLELIELSSADLEETLRFVNNTQSIVSNGYTYQACKFGLILPTASLGNSSRAKFSISNIDRKPVEVIRTINIRNPLVLKGWVIRSDEPDVVEIGPFEFTLRKTSWDHNTLSGDLYDDVEGGFSVPRIRYTTSLFPGLSGLA